MSSIRENFAKLALGGAVALGTLVPLTLAATPAWATYAPTTKGTTSSTVPISSDQSAAASTSGTASTDGLAFTGADITGGLAIAGLAIAGGGTLVVASRRRKASA